MLGDLAKGAQAIVKLSHEPKLLMHVQLGSDSLTIMKTKADIIIRDVEEFKEISRMSDRDGMDGVSYGDKIIKKFE